MSTKCIFRTLNYIHQYKDRRQYHSNYKLRLFVTLLIQEAKYVILAKPVG
jgi:hypothetical protein